MSAVIADRGRRRQRPRWLIAAIAVLVLFAVNAVLQPSLLSQSVIQSNVTSFLPLILVAIGQTYVVLAADIDLSVGSIIALVNVSVVVTIEALGGSGWAMLAGIGVGLLVALCCGLINGLCVAVLRFQPIVATFATAIVFGGAALWVLPQAGGTVPQAYWRGYAGAVLGMRVTVLIAAVALVLVVALARTTWYRRLVATGGNLLGSYQTGLPVTRLRLSGYLMAGLFSGLAALCLVGETASGDPLLGPSFTLSSISAVVLGGIALSGGSGDAIGSILGAVALGLINNIVFFAGVPFAAQDLLKGLIILCALAGGVLESRR